MKAKQKALAIDDSDNPRAGEKLFTTASGNWRLNAHVRDEWHQDAAWVRYIDGYKFAAEAALKAVQAEFRERDSVVFPIVHLYRQRLELCLKAIVVFGNGLFDQSFQFPGHHNLTALWSLARPLLIQRWGKHRVLKAVGEQIEEFAHFDGGSFSYRYPVQRDGKTSSHPATYPREPGRQAKPFEQTNIEHFCGVARRLTDFLQGCAYGFWCELDLKQQAKADALDWEVENLSMC